MSAGLSGPDGRCLALLPWLRSLENKHSMLINNSAIRVYDMTRLELERAMEGRRGSGNRGFMVALESAPADHEDKTHFVIHDSIGYLLAVNARMLQRVMTARLAATGVMHAHWSIMLALWAGDGITQKQLSARVAIEGPTLTRALERM